MKTENYDVLEKKTENISVSTSNWFLYFCGITANLMLISYGCCQSWTSPLLATLRSNNSEINPLGEPITTIQVSVLASIPIATQTCTLVVMAKLADKFGRKKILTYVAIINFCLLFAMAFTSNIYVYYPFLFLLGLAQSGSIICSPLYINEISGDDNRGKMGCTLGISVMIGILVGFIFGSFTCLKTATLLCSTPAILHLLLAFAIPESPVYLISHGKNHNAVNALESLRRTRDINTIDKELIKLETMVKIEQKQRTGKISDLFKQRATRKGFLISIVIYLCQQFSGINIIIAYISILFNEAGLVISGSTMGVILGFVNVFTYILAAFVVDKLGRRILLLTSSFTCVVPMFFLGLYFHLIEINPNLLENIQWLPIVCGIVYTLSFGIGLGPIPLAMVGELFSHELRAVGIAIVFFTDCCFIFLVVFCFPLISEIYGKHTSIWILNSVTLFGSITIFFILPETKGKSISEIQEILSK